MSNAKATNELAEPTRPNFSQAALAASALLMQVASVTADQTELSTSSLEASGVEQAAPGLQVRFGLSEAEASAYQQIMRGPEGHWYRDLDPLWVLGIAATSEQKRMWYAHKAAEREHLRAERELAFQRAYRQVWRERAADFPLIDLQRWDRARVASAVVRNQDSGAEVTERLAVYIHASCESCEKNLAAVLARATPKRAVDVYIDGLADDNGIRDWAQAAGIDARKVTARLITLNAADTQFAEFLAETPQSTSFAVFRQGPLGLMREHGLEIQP